MKLLMLRGQVPQDRDPQEIVFNDIWSVDDMWTQLTYAMSDSKNPAELWYWGGKREKKFAPHFTERWVPSFLTYKNDFIPDVILCRGGFPEYHHILTRFPDAFKIYYGAGRRYLPLKGFQDYDLILQDSPEQLEECRRRFPKINASLFIKPAADNIFQPMDAKKEYDVCFPANGAQKFKGHDFIYSTVPENIKLLNLGNNPHNFKYPGNVTSYRVVRSDMAKNIAKCKIGIVAVQSTIDSCPRVIPEMLACGLPIVVLDNVRFWKERYILPNVTGELATRGDFWRKVRYVLKNSHKYQARSYYENALSTDSAAKHILAEVFYRRTINELSF